MTKHEFSSTGWAYDACQSDENIKTGDMLIIIEDGETIIGLAGTWPVAVTVASRNLHSPAEGADIGRLAADFGWTDEQIRAAVAEATARGAPVREAFTAYLASKAAAAKPMATTVMTDYLEKLEAAILDAEWWLADYPVAQRKDSRGEKKRTVFAAADLVRQRKLEAWDR